MKKKILVFTLAVIVIFSISGILAAINANKAIQTANSAVGAARLQDLNATKAYLGDSKKEFENTKKFLIVFTPLRVIPLVGWYIADVQRGINAAISALDGANKLVEAISPYADVLGLEGEGTFLGGTAQERLAKALETLSKVAPQIDDVGIQLAEARNDIEKIESWRYPNILPGKPGEKIVLAQDSLKQLESFIVDSKPLLLVLPEIMGQNGEKKYLILFQNDKELRATGGFITAYAVFRVENGIIASEGSSDIYALDNTLLKKVPAPDPIINYLPDVSTLNLRDSNLSPDYKVSMQQFEDLYKFTSDYKEIDGIISLDTNFVVKLMDVLGPIDAYGTSFTTEEVEQCDCPQVIWELEKYADEPVGFDKSSRKDIISVLMLQIMDKAFNAPKSTWPNLLGTGIESLRKKYLLMYYKDPVLQEAIEKINFGGRLHQFDGDYIHINETNFAGAKSNLFIEEEVKQEIKKGEDGKINKTLTISYKYPREGDNCSLERAGGLCLAGIYRDWIRVYVPQGSQLKSSSGAEVEFSQREELGKTVFEGFFTIRPTGTAELILEYTVPLELDGEYKLLIQKQPGTEGHTYSLDAFGKKVKKFSLETDKELIVKL